MCKSFGKPSGLTHMGRGSADNNLYGAIIPLRKVVIAANIQNVKALAKYTHCKGIVV